MHLTTITLRHSATRKTDLILIEREESERAKEKLTRATHAKEMMGSWRRDHQSRACSRVIKSSSVLKFEPKISRFHSHRLCSQGKDR